MMRSALARTARIASTSLVAKAIRPIAEREEANHPPRKSEKRAARVDEGSGIDL